MLAELCCAVLPSAKQAKAGLEGRGGASGSAGCEYSYKSEVVHMYMSGLSCALQLFPHRLDLEIDDLRYTR